MVFHVLLLLFFVAFASPIAEGQIRNIPITKIEGTVYCTTNSTVNGTSIPVFRGALVALRCAVGNFSIPTSIALSKASGNFTIASILRAQIPVSYFINKCNLVVLTPLKLCNRSLPLNGGLTSSLKYVGNTITNGIFNSTNFVPSGFRYETKLPR